MTWLLEDPLYVVIPGVLAVAILGWGFLKMGHRGLLHGALASLSLTGGCLFLEQMVVTPSEEVQLTLEEIAEHVRQNDLEALLAHVYSGAPEVRAQAMAEFPRYQFERVSIKSNFRVDFDDRHMPPKAVAEFNVVVTGNDTHGSRGWFRVAEYVIVTLYRQEGQWLVAEYQHRPPHWGFTKRRPPTSEPAAEQFYPQSVPPR